MKSLVWQQNRHQKVFYRLGGLYICAVGLDILKLNKHHCFIVLHIEIRGELELVSEGLSPSKTPRGYGTMWQNFRLLFNTIDSQQYLGYMICQACNICQTFCL